MAAPRVEWTNISLNPVSNWHVGEVNAGEVSADMTFLIWNNRGQGTAVSDMENVTITTKDSTGGNSAEFIANKWVEIKVNSMDETTFTPIGGTTTKQLKASGATVPAGVIKGSINDGTYASAKDNFCEFTVRLNVPSITTTTGNQNGYLRLSYTHV